MTYVFDLDHTLCETVKNFNGDWNYLEALPFPERIKHVNLLFDQGNNIIIETARGSYSKRNWYEETHKQLVGWGLKFHILRTGVKFSADFYVDDKGINSEDFFTKKIGVKNG